MPTLYTAAIADDITFNDFAMLCARAMGALVMMRESLKTANEKLTSWPTAEMETKR